MKPSHIKPLSITLISCLGIIVYSNTFHCSFHYGDMPFIIDNSPIRNTNNLFNIWEFYPCRFVTFLTLAFNYHFCQLNVPGYHLFNLAVHLIAAILVWWLTLLTLSTPTMKENKITRHAHLIALFAGLVFVSHPVQTEAVTYIWQRAASMAAMFYLASLCFYVKSRMLSIRHCEEPKATRQSLQDTFYYICSLIMAIVAMFTKENTISLPLMILLYEICFFETKKNLNWKLLSPFLLTLLVIPLTTLLTEPEYIHEIKDIARGPGGVSPMHYLLTQFRVMVTYIRLVFVPIDQNLYYEYPIFKNILELPVLLSFSFLITILFGAKRLFSKYRLVSFSIFWFFLTLLPESSFLPQKDVIFEHRLYLPLVGYSIFLVSGAYYLLQKSTIKTMVAALTVMIACNSVLTYQRNKIWKDEISLWEDVIRKSPHQERAYFDHGYLYANQGNLTQALFYFNKAIELNPKDERAYGNRGLMYYKQGNFARALSDFNKAIEINPNYADPFLSRGVLYVKLGKFSQAFADFSQAIEISPGYAEAYNNRSNLYVQKGDLTKALSDFNKSITIDPYHAEVYYNRGLIYLKQSNFAQAISDFSKTIEINPNFVDAYFNRGNAYYQQKDLDRAIIDYTDAVGLNPRYQRAYNNLIAVYFGLREFDKAWAYVHKAQEAGCPINPKLIQALKKGNSF